MGVEALLLKCIPWVSEHAPGFALWVMGAIVKPIIGEKAKSILKTKAERAAYATALKRAFADFVKEFPELTASFFDEHFLVTSIADELALLLTRDEVPDVSGITQKYNKQFHSISTSDVSVAVTRFLSLVENHCRKEKILNEILDHRQIDESNRILRKISQSPFLIEALDLNASGSLMAKDSQIEVGRVIRAFQNASQELLNWRQTLVSGEWLDRPELGQLIDRIDSTDLSLSLLLGLPGSGKSALLARLANVAGDHGWSVLAIKADQLPEDVASLDGLQAYFELPAPLSDCLKATAQAGKVLILIDQLDALSELIDLKTRRLTVLLRLINQSKGIHNIHIVSSCRIFERTYDKRLNTIDADEIHLSLPIWEAVNAILTGRGLNATAWPDAFREILRVPQHLNLFLRYFVGSGEARIFESYLAMLEEIWRQRLLVSPEHPNASTLVHEIATEMAEREVLFVPVAKFDRQYSDLEYVVASGILQYDHLRRQVAFTHQTLFDFARARAFITKEQSLSRYVIERQTGMFVRPKLWSALNYLRGADIAAYRRELEAIFGAPNLRLHIRILLIDFIGQQDQPFDFEIQLLRPAFRGVETRVGAFNAIVGRQAWFEVIENDILPAAMCDSPDVAWLTIGVLEAAWTFARPKVLEYVRTYWVPEATKSNYVWYVLRGLKQWDRDAIEILIKFIEGGNIANSSVHDLASVASLSAPQLAPELIGAQLRVLVRDAIKLRKPKEPSAEGGAELSELLESRYKDPLKAIIDTRNEWYEVTGIAEAAPDAYLTHVWPPIKCAIELIAAEDQSQSSLYRADHLLGTMLEVNLADRQGAENPLMDSLVYAVIDCAKQFPLVFRSFVEANKTSDAMTVHRLIAIGLVELAAIDPQFVLEYLLADYRRLSLENFHEDERETKMLLQALIPKLSPNDCKRVEEFILNADPFKNYKTDDDLKKRFHARKICRRFRLRLLLKFPANSLTPSGQSLIDSELRIFSDFADTRRDVRSWVSKSPLSAEKMLDSNDDTISRFLNAFPDATEWGDHFRGNGGSIEASRAFAAFAKQNPQRAVAIIESLDFSTQQRPAAYAIGEFSEKELSNDALFDLILKLDRKGFDGEIFRNSAADALRKRINKPDTGLPDKIIEILERWLREWKFGGSSDEVDSDHDEPNKDERTGSLLWGYGGAYALPQGSYSILNAYFFGLLTRKSIPGDRLISTLEGHLAKGDGIEVWGALAHDALTRLRFVGHALAEQFLLKLFDAYPKLLARKSGLFLLAHTIAWATPDATAIWLERMRKSGWHLADQAFGELVVLRAVLKKSDRWSRQIIEDLLVVQEPIAPNDVNALSGVVHAAVNLWRETQDRIFLSKIICVGMDSTDKNVASAAIDWFRVVDEVPITDDSREILRAFTNGKSLGVVGARSFALDRLADLVEAVPDLVYKVARREVDRYKANLGNFATVAALESENLLSIALTLQRLDEPHRSNGLDLFELLLRYNAYKVRDVLMDIDRRPGASTPSARIRRRGRRKRQ